MGLIYKAFDNVAAASIYDDNDDNNNTYISSNDWIILSTRNPSSQHIRPVKSFISWEYRWNQRLHTGPICLICYFPVSTK